MRRLAAATLAFGLVVTACSSGGSDGAGTASPVPPAPLLPPTSAAPASTAPPTSPPSSAPPPSTLAPLLPETEPPDPETDTTVLTTFVEAATGLRFGETPTVTDADLPGDDLAELAEVFISEEAWELFFALGLVDDPDGRLAAGRARLEQVRGVCCPVTLFDQGDDPLLTEVVLVHELTHLIDRARDRPRASTSEEVVPMFTAVSEGNAQRVAFAYRDQLVAVGADPAVLTLDWSHPDIPPAVLDYLEFAYEEGAEFSIGLEELGGLELVNQSFRRLPASSEQILDVRAYVSDERPLAVATPSLDPSASVRQEGTIGAFVLRLVAQQHLELPGATDLALAWSGDRYVVADGPDGRCLEATIVMDDAASTATLREVLRRSEVSDRADVDSSTTVHLTRCV